MNCPGCGEQSPPGAKFCRFCGLRLSTGCPACGRASAADSRFCEECGAALDRQVAERPGSRTLATYTPRHLVERILKRRAALEGEVKQVTVLFCDLCDSTTIAERLGAEAMHQLLEQFFDRTLAVVHYYEGTINQFLGDGFMALFGAPLALEDHARRALFAAVEIRRALSEGRWRELETELRVRIGINTGSVVVGKIGDDLRTDYTAIGDVTNVAARLQQGAEPGDIVVSASTQRLAGDAIRFEFLGPRVVKGKTTPLDAYRLLGLGLRRSPTRDLSDRPLTPFVGREQEIAALRALLAGAEQGRGAVVGIVGEPGIGKSRLLLEFRRGLDPSRLTYLEARCLPFSRSVPYALMLDVLRADCGIADTDTPEDIASKVRFGLAEVGLLDDERAAALLAMLGVKEDDPHPSPETTQRRVFDTLRLMTLRGSRRRPLLIALEDLHWIDRASEEFFVELADGLMGASVLLLVTYRPGYPSPFMGRSYATQLALSALGPEISERLVEATSPSGRPEMTRAIVERAGGNPFYLEELARSLGDAATGTVPATVQDVIAARIDGLPDHPRRLLQVAAVIGRVFSRAVLERVWDGPQPIDPWLRELMRSEFVHEQIGQEDEYVFCHALTQDVAYASLLERHRRSLHGAVAAAIETVYASAAVTTIELIAHHYGLSDDQERAVDYAIRAGEKAQRRWANAEALAYFEDALRRLDTLPTTSPNALRRIDAVLKQAEVAFALGRHVEQLRALEHLADLVRNQADPPRQAAWHYWTGFLHSLTGSRPDVAIDHCEQAATIARAHGLPALEAYAQSCLAQVALFVGDLRRGLHLGEQAVSSFEGRGDFWWAGRTLGHLSPIANALGEWASGLTYGQRALAHARTLSDRRLNIMALLRIASTLIQMGKAADGLRVCDEATVLEPGPFDLATVRAIRGYGLVKSGEAARGVTLLEEVGEWLERSRLRYTQCQIALWLCEAYLQAGAPDRARPVLMRVLDDAAALRYRNLQGVAHRLLAATLEPGADADAHTRTAIELLREVDARYEEAKARETAAAHARRSGRIGEARGYLQTAVALFDTLGMRDDAARIRTDLGGVS